MPSRDFHASRRSEFLRRLDGPVVLFAGGLLPRNYQDNAYPFRADSNFLYLFPDAEPDAAALFDPADGTVKLFLHDRTPETALWHGAQPSLAEMREVHAVDDVLPIEQLESTVRAQVNGRALRSLAVSDPVVTARARALTGEALDFASSDGPGDGALIDLLCDMRAAKGPEEVEEMRMTAGVTREAHVAAMRATKIGGTEQELTGIVDGTFWRHGCTPAYSTILSVRGEVLHNHDHSNTLLDGDIVLLDAGAEAPSGYCSDVTRSWPVSGKFTPEAAEIYDIVLRAELAAIEAAMPGVRYRDVHLTACRVVADGLVQMGLMKGDADGLVESGAHAMFFPHGVGHLIGIDVHDMEGFGDRVHYPNGRTRSDAFGTRFLRMDRDLVEGNVFTIEPGIYFVPAILNEPELKAKHGASIDYGRVQKFLDMNDGRGFGGIRIEDDVMATDGGPEVLTAAVPKERSELEAIIGTA